MYSQDRDSFRSAFIAIHAKLQRGDPLQTLERQIAEVILLHPEYHGFLAQDDHALSAEFTPEDGQTNPFLHMALHLAIREQAGTDRPAGIRDEWLRLTMRHGEHDGEHRMLECLGQSLWEAQRNGRAPDEDGYLACVRTL